MTYDPKGLGYAELTQTALYMPEVYDTVMDALEAGYSETEVLQTIHKAIAVYNMNQLEEVA